MYEVYTLEEVLAEIRDERARQFLASQPYKMIVKSLQHIADEDMATVKSFSRETGDLRSLSQVDMMVIALGLTLAREKGEFDKVKLAPNNFAEFKPNTFKSFYNDNDDDFWNKDESEEKPVKADDGFDDFVTTSTKKTHNKVQEGGLKLTDKQKKKMEKAAMLAAALEDEEEQSKPEEKKDEPTATESKEGAEEAQPDEASLDDDEFDDEEEGGEWVTATNIHKHVSGGESQNLLQNRDMMLFKEVGPEDEAKKEEDSKKEEEPKTEEEQKAQKKQRKIINSQPVMDYVKFITADFAMQNVII
mmetsp:Transcript_22952/g.35385  ORF Transcript_22952/g.35385 Transcript_22952/m.35385 type:complete len:303 (-) Transcript_22952:539-1447(-)